MTSGISTAFSGILGFGFPGGYEWVILLILALLIFGRRLPEVGRSLGKSIVEFKRGIKGIEDEIEAESSRSDSKPQVPSPPPPQELPRPSAPAEPVVPYQPKPADQASPVPPGAAEAPDKPASSDSGHVSG